MGALFPMVPEHIKEFPFPGEEDAEGRAGWQDDVDATLSEMARQGYYNFELWPASSLLSGEWMVCAMDTPARRRLQQPARAQQMSREQIERAGVPLRGSADDPLRYMFASTENSMLNLANDAAYTPGCTEAEYEERVVAA